MFFKFPLKYMGYPEVLYTPSDLDKAKDSKELKFSARQNFIFENGYLMSKIGRSNVCALIQNRMM